MPSLVVWGGTMQALRGCARWCSIRCLAGRMKLAHCPLLKKESEDVAVAIWSKGGDGTDALVHEFTVGDDWLYDRHIAPYDCLGCIAHASMLGQTGIIPADDAKALVSEVKSSTANF